MNKTELVKKIAEKADVTAVDAKKALDAAVEAIKEAVVAGDKVQLLGFGTFLLARVLILLPALKLPSLQRRLLSLHRVQNLKKRLINNVNTFRIINKALEYDSRALLFLFHHTDVRHHTQQCN